MEESSSRADQLSRRAAASAVLADELVLLAIRLTRRLRALTPPGELSGPEVSALAVLVHGGRMTMGQLSSLEEVRPPSLTPVVRRLEERGLVARQADTSDRRVQWVEATTRGKEVFVQGHRRRLEPLVGLLDSLGSEEREALERALPVLRQIANVGG